MGPRAPNPLSSPIPLFLVELGESVYRKGAEGHLGGSVVEHLPSAQVVILWSWDQVLRQAPHKEPASPSAYVSASLSVSLMNKMNLKILKERKKER